MEVGRFCLFLLLMGIGCTAFSGDEPADLSRLICSEPACGKVARKDDYKANKLERSITLKLDHFLLQVPDEPISKMVSSEGEIILYYKDGQRLLVAEDSGPDVGELVDMDVNQFPSIVFTKTAKDMEPKAHTDLFLWKVALYQKPSFFNRARDVSYSENNDVSYFMSDSKEMGFSGSAMVSEKNIKKYFYA